MFAGVRFLLSANALYLHARILQPLMSPRVQHLLHQNLAQALTSSTKRQRLEQGVAASPSSMPCRHGYPRIQSPKHFAAPQSQTTQVSAPARSIKNQVRSVDVAWAAGAIPHTWLCWRLWTQLWFLLCGSRYCSKAQRHTAHWMSNGSNDIQCQAQASRCCSDQDSSCRTAEGGDPSLKLLHSVGRLGLVQRLAFSV